MLFLCCWRLPATLSGKLQAPRPRQEPWPNHHLGEWDRVALLRLTFSLGCGFLSLSGSGAGSTGPPLIRLVYLQAGRSYPGIDEGDRLNCARVWLNHPLPYTVGPLNCLSDTLRLRRRHLTRWLAMCAPAYIYIFNGFLFVGRCDPFFAFYGFLCVFPVFAASLCTLRPPFSI